MRGERTAGTARTTGATVSGAESTAPSSRSKSATDPSADRLKFKQILSGNALKEGRGELRPSFESHKIGMDKLQFKGS